MTILGCATVGASLDAAATSAASATRPLSRGALAVVDASAKTRRTPHAATGRHTLRTCAPFLNRSLRHQRPLRRGCQAVRHSRREHHVKRPSSAPAPPTTPVLSAVSRARASTIATVLATPCPNTQLKPEADNLALIRAAILCLINKERAQNGESPLQLSEQLEQAAESHNSDMIAANYFQHVSPTGTTPVDRIRTTGYIPNHEVGYVIGENLAWGTLELATPQAIVSAWIASPGHLENILEGQYRDTGIGVVAEVPASLANGAAGATYSQEFGVIIR